MADIHHHRYGEVDVTERSFAGPRSDWNPYGHTMLEIFARA